MKKGENLFVENTEASEKNKEAIKLSILESARLAAEKIISDAEAECERLLNEAKADIAAQKEENIKKATVKAEEIALRSGMLSKLDCKKHELSEKQKLVSLVYEKAEQGFRNMPDDMYKAYFARIVEANAEKDDEVVLSKNEKRLDSVWLKAINNKTDKNLTLSLSFHDEDGGVVLRSARYDKSLTIPTLLAEVREATENEIVKRLFE